MIFPDGPPDPITTPKPATSCDGLDLIRSNPEMSSEGPEAALERLERPKTADVASCAASFEQVANQRLSTDQSTSLPTLQTPIQTNGDGGEKEELLIGMALGDPDEDIVVTTNNQETVHHCSLEVAEHPVMQATEESSSVTNKVSEERDLSTVPSEREQITVISDPLHSKKPSTTSLSPVPHSDRQREAFGLVDVNKPLKRKPSRWNILGGWFGKKNVPTESAPTQTYQMSDDSKPFAHHKEDVLIGTESLGVVPKGKDRNHRSRSSSTRLTKPKGGTRPTFRKTRTAPSPHPSEHGRNPFSKESNADSTFPQLQLDGQPMLSVDIPDIQLDRYSVMFGGLLRSTSPLASQPSLLVRRKAHLEDVKTDCQEGEVLIYPTCKIS